MSERSKTASAKEMRLHCLIQQIQMGEMIQEVNRFNYFKQSRSVVLLKQEQEGWKCNLGIFHITLVLKLWTEG
jgi:hypothetical protein